ncbi:MAG TPA: hemolysin D, partial [Thermoanaerobaculia bacterium]
MLFRGEALEHYQRGQDDEAHVLELEPRWTRYTSRVIVALFAAALLYASLVHVDRYAEGTGVVRGG